MGEENRTLSLGPHFLSGLWLGSVCVCVWVLLLPPAPCYAPGFEPYVVYPW